MTKKVTPERAFSSLMEMPERVDKPRTRGLSILMGDGSVSRRYLDAYGEFIDIFKILDEGLWMPREVCRQNIERLREYDIDVQMGGIPYELATLTDKEEEFLQEAEDLNIDVLEVETHAARRTIAEMEEEIDQLTSRGFRVVGEVGSKWTSSDRTRIRRNQIDVDKTAMEMNRLLDAGAEKIYWEGLVVVNLIGKHLDNRDGQQQLMEVVDEVGHENIVFEVWGRDLSFSFGFRTAPVWAWLITQYGPDVNIGNAMPEDLPTLESTRRGTHFEYDHPYLRWLKEGKPTEKWWDMNPPNYDVDIEE